MNVAQFNTELAWTAWGHHWCMWWQVVSSHIHHWLVESL